MYGRYNITLNGPAFFDFFQVTRTLELKPRYNVAPSAVPVIVHPARCTKLHLAL